MHRGQCCREGVRKGNGQACAGSVGPLSSCSWQGHTQTMLAGAPGSMTSKLKQAQDMADSRGPLAFLPDDSRSLGDG